MWYRVSHSLTDRNTRRLRMVNNYGSYILHPICSSSFWLQGLEEGFQLESSWWLDGSEWKGGVNTAHDGLTWKLLSLTPTSCWLNRCSIFSSVVLLRLGDKLWKKRSVWFWRERDLNPGTSTSYTDTLPLNHDVLPSFEVSLWVLTHGITQKLCKITLIWNVALSHIWHSAQNLLQNKYKCTKCCWSKCLK